MLDLAQLPTYLRSFRRRADIRMRRRVRILLASSLFALSMTMAGACTTDKAPPRSPVLLIALDGLEWTVVIDMLREGRLPNIAGRLRAGTFGELETMHPSLSPAIWASVATGVKPRAHGIHGFVKSGGDGGPRLFTSRDRRTKALWNIASDHGLRSGVVGWWNTYPVEPLSGVMVAQSNTSPKDRNEHGGIGILKGSLRQGVDHQVEPAQLAPRVFGLADEVDRNLDVTLGRVFRRPAPTGTDAIARMWQESRWSLRADLEYERISLDLLAGAESFDLFLVYFGGTDVLAHRFWRWAHPQEYAPPPDAKSVEAYGSILTDYYAYVDEAVGRLVAAAPPQAIVILMSDHGMRPANRKQRFDPSIEGRPPRSGSHGKSDALFIISGPGIRRAAPDVETGSLRRPDIPRLGRIFDVAPTVLALLGLPVGADMEGKAMTEVIEPSLLQARPLKEVPTHTPPGWFRSRALPQSEEPHAEERLEQLRSLGYIE
ncbi:MAG: alkaline phosphatase family protein [Candidatus Binatia bacterium]